MIRIIFNPKSGHRKTARTLRSIARTLTRKGIDFDVRPTEYAGHCKTLIAESERLGIHDFILLGGDGTFHEALNGITDFERTTLLLIPCGSGNDFVGSDRRLNRKPAALLRAMLAGSVRLVDYIRMSDGKRCLNVAGTGLDIEVLLKARAMRRLTGSPRYIAALKRALRSFEPYPIRVTRSGRTDTYECIMVGVANGKRIGGGIRLSPKSVIDDGTLDLVIIENVPRNRIKRILPGFLIGRHIDKPYCVWERLENGARIELAQNSRIQLDGEIYCTEFDCEIVRGGLRVYC